MRNAPHERNQRRHAVLGKSNPKVSRTKAFTFPDSRDHPRSAPRRYPRGPDELVLQLRMHVLARTSLDPRRERLRSRTTTIRNQTRRPGPASKRIRASPRALNRVITRPEQRTTRSDCRKNHAPAAALWLLQATRIVSQRILPTVSTTLDETHPSRRPTRNSTNPRGIVEC